MLRRKYTSFATCCELEKMTSSLLKQKPKSTTMELEFLTNVIRTVPQMCPSETGEWHSQSKYRTCLKRLWGCLKTDVSPNQLDSSKTDQSLLETLFTKGRDYLPSKAEVSTVFPQSLQKFVLYAYGKDRNTHVITIPLSKSQFLTKKYSRSKLQKIFRSGKTPKALGNERTQMVHGCS
jgi:hypothetical protein